VAPAKSRPPSAPDRSPAPAKKRTPQATFRARLEEQLRFEALLSDLSARFVNVEPSELDREIEAAQGKICRALGIDRSTLGLFIGPEDTPFFTHSWATGGFEPDPVVPLDSVYPWIVSEIKRGNTVRFTSIDDLPAEAAVDKETLRRLGPKSNLTFPLKVSGRVLGGLSFGMLREERAWPEELVGRLRLVAQIFSGALEHRRIEGILRESEAKLALATESAGVGIWAYDHEQGQFWTTPTNRAIFGLPGEGPLPLAVFLGLIHPADRERVVAAIQEALEAPNQVSQEYRIVRPDDGMGRWIFSRGGAHGAPTEKGARLTGVSMDITGRKLAEEEAARVTQEFRTMFDLSAMGMAQVDPSTDRFLRVNQKFSEITGYTEEELRELTFKDITFPGDPPNDPVGYAKVLAGEAKDWSVEKRYRRKDGTARWVIVRGSAVHDGDGRAILSMAAIADITDRREAEVALRESESKYRALYESLRDAYVRVDLEGHLLEWNRAYGEMLGYSDGEMASLTYQEITPDRWRKAEAEIISQQVLTRGYSDVYEKEYRGKDGTVFPVELRTFLLRDGSGQPSGMWAIVRDLSERRRAEEEAQALRDALTHVTRVATLGELTASLAHELNQPLSAIQSNAQTAQRLLERGGVASGELTDILQDIVADNRRASDMIRHLRAALKKGKAETEHLNVGDLIREVTALVLPDILKRDATLLLDLPSDVPPVRGDKIQLQQVLLNLMINALEAMGDSEGGYLKVRCRAHEPGGVRVSVEDSGPGIPEGKLEGIFEPFYTTKPEGLGMGLTICRSIARSHGGKLWAESRPRSGAVFHLALPAAPAED
jgi:two-component system, LuxR family, sensor kinase FixL